MSLIDAMMQDFTIIDKKTTGDGEGGNETEYVDGAIIKAIATLDTSMQSRIAEKQGVTSIWTITTPKNVVLDFHDILRRESDGKIFRVTTKGGDKQAPDVSSLDISQVAAEENQLP